MLQENYLYPSNIDGYNDNTIKEILSYLLGEDGEDDQKYFSNYIDSIDANSNHIIDYMNKLFIKELKLLINNLDYSNEKFDVNTLSVEIKKHLINDNFFKIRYFIK